MPSSIPLVTATPLVDTVTLLHGSDNGAILQFPLAANATRTKEMKQQRLRGFLKRAIVPCFRHTRFAIFCLLAHSKGF